MNVRNKKGLQKTWVSISTEKESI